MSQKRMFHTFKEARQRGFYDEYPMLPPDVDPQLHLSRNDRPQPFYLTCEGDTMLVQMSGQGRVEFHDSCIRYYTLEPGDFIYVPGGTAHRLLPSSESIVYRYKAQRAGLQAISWYCVECDECLYRESWDTAGEQEQAAFLRIANAFNADDELRTCPTCDVRHPQTDIEGNRWQQIAAELTQQGGGQSA